MQLTYGEGFQPLVSPVPSREVVARVQREVAKLPQYQPLTKHYFHGGMYCREVWRGAGVTVVGRVHRKEHFYLILYGRVVITTDEGVQHITGPRLLQCKPGTKRVVHSLTPTLCMTFHITNATTVEDAERELVEDDPSGMFGPGNLLKHQSPEALP